MTTQVPARITGAERRLARVETAEEAKQLYDELETLRQYAIRVKATNEQQNEIGRLKLRTIRKGGQLLAATPNRYKSDSRRASESLPEGFTYSMSSRWQRVAGLTDEAFAEVLAADEVTLAAAVNRAGRGERDRRIRAERAAAVAAAKASGMTSTIDQGDIRSWRPTVPVACVITDPPYITGDAVELHSLLADFAVDVLPDHGALVVMTWQPILPAVLAAMRRPQLVYRWAVAWTYGTAERTPDHARRVFDGWKPILVFHKNGWAADTTYLYDLIVSRDADKESHEWGQSVSGFRHLVRAFSTPGETVCDPFAGGGTTVLAALAESCHFVGCDIDAEAVAAARERTAA